MTELTKYKCPGVLIYGLACSDEDVLVITHGAWGSTLYLYSLHQLGGDHESERLKWTPSLINGLAGTLPKPRRLAHQIDIDAGHTAAWHYACEYGVPPHVLASALEMHTITDITQIKKYDAIMATIKEMNP